MGTANVNLLVGAFMVFKNLPVVQWTEQKVSNLLMGVRFLPGRQRMAKALKIKIADFLQL